MEELEGICEIGKLMSKGSCHKTRYKKRNINSFVSFLMMTF